MCPESVAAAVKLGLARHGLLSPSGRLRVQEFSKAFSEHFSPFEAFVPLHHLGASTTASTSRIHRVLSGSRGRSIHPIVLSALGDWLFGSVDSLLSAARDGAGTSTLTLERETRPKSHARGNPYGADKRLELVRLVQRDHLSARKAAEQLGISTNTALGWLAQAGYSPMRKPKRLERTLLEKVRAALGQGTSQADVARRFTISMSSVSRILVADASLMKLWRARCSEADLVHHRDAWTAAVASAQAGSVKVARSAAPATYAWLYRNDREWLQLVFGRTRQQAGRAEGRAGEGISFAASRQS
ncbi:TnsD family Tn7-like transposition protein [Ramlibacter sp. AN1015]|uniref:TnsD family Tn7-like transposition protein n=1 Tax=Ramlibacter sp. AN1015 TaxID=3133428 RepID=UPI0030BF2A81